MNPLAILEKKFGYSSFRLEQEQIIESILNKKDTFVLMPTGGGKSLCYQVPAMMLPGLTVVISPLIALMKDQVDALRVNGVDAAYLNSTQTSQEQHAIIQKARDGKLKLLYMAPERLISSASSGMGALASLDLSLIAIDEAHCISQWGHDFRPEYLMLAQLKQNFPHVPVIALTATADKLTRKDIVEKLALTDPAIFISSFNRPNIRYNVEPKRDYFESLLNFLGKHEGQSGIIYCLSRLSTEKLASDLRESGFNALAYHAGMDSQQRALHQDKFLRDEVPIIVATIAFGMGINKSNVRFVVHVDLPKNIEGYYQETGRAGRDGLESEALLFFSLGDVMKLKSFAKVDGNEEQTEIAFRKLDQMAEYGTITTCRRKFLLNYFDEQSDSYCGNCDVCLTKIELYDGTDRALKVLKAVYELNEKYGSGYVIDILRGSNSIKLHAEDKELGCYGSGRDLPREVWHSIIQDLTERKYLIKTPGMYPLLTLSPSARQALEGNSRIMLTRAKERIVQEKTVNYEVGLFDLLREVRLKLATAENVPAYVVISDAGLIEIAQYFPQNREQLRKISGFGEMKIQKYANAFVEVVVQYCNANNLESRVHLKPEKRQHGDRIERDNDTKKQTLELFRKGHSIEKIGVLRGLTVSTVETHLAFYILQGILDIKELLSAHEVAMIRRAINTAENGMLSTIKQRAGDDFSYGQIKLVLADMQRERERDKNLIQA
jgi:ATP-dependent DNA helicase RecQ